MNVRRTIAAARAWWASTHPDAVGQVVPELMPRSIADLDADFVYRLAASLDKLQFRRQA